jgi:hypothetical protein
MAAGTGASGNDAAWQFLAVMFQFGPAPNVFTYSASISACEKGEGCQQALGPSAVMQQSPLVPNVFTYSAVIRTCK